MNLANRQNILTISLSSAVVKSSQYFKNNYNYDITGIDYSSGEMDSIKGTDGLVVCTEWLQFRNPNFEKLASELKDRVIFDGRNLYDPEKLKLFGLSHVGIGIPPSKVKAKV